MLDTLTVVLMLSASLLHASWHSLVKYGGDQIIVLVGMGLVAAVVAVCALPFLPFPSLSVWEVIAGSVLLHVSYKFALARSYFFADLGQAYPLARGFVPLIATAGAFLLLGQTPALFQILGIGCVSLGLIWLAAHSVRGGVDRRLLLSAFVAGSTVAAYSLLDAYGARLSGDWASFTAWLVVADSSTFALLTYGTKGQQLWRNIWRERWRVLASGILGLLSFSVFLWALSRSPVGPVSALREASVLFATVIGMVIYGEEKSLAKAAATGLIVIGLITIAALH